MKPVNLVDDHDIEARRETGAIFLATLANSV
jgi:hypothetical protein